MLVEDASGYRGEADVVVAPASEAELVAFLRRASEQGTPVTISGAGTGVTGGRVPSGGALLSLEKFNGVEIRSGGTEKPAGMRARRQECRPHGFATVGAGAILRDLHAAAARSGQFYPPDPTETSAEIGGTIATNASGSRSFRYGDTRRHVLRLRVVLMDGRVLDVRRGDAVDFPVPQIPIPNTTKHTGGYRLSPGMDWIDLFVGSEGTLGVVIEADLRLLPAAEDILAGVVFFPDDASALDAVDGWRERTRVRMIEYFDRPSLDLLRTRFPETPRAGAALLFEEEDGDPERWSELLAGGGALIESSWFAANPADRERFRRFRHALPELVNDTVRRNGFMKLGSDYAVPLDRNRDMMAEYRRRLDAEFPGAHVIFGHIGDAHLHVNILPTTQDQFTRGQALMIDFARKAVSLGGTVSAEHGLGKRKAHLLALQYTADQIEAMKQVKRRLDPPCLLGRGTLFPI